MESSGSTTRREFAKSVAMAAVAVPVLASVEACTPAATGAAVATASSAPPPRADESAIDPVAVALANVVRAKAGSRLTAGQLVEVRKGIEANLQAAHALRNFDLPTATEPAFAFRAYRGGER
jgi:hypothetical protein